MIRKFAIFSLLFSLSLLCHGQASYTNVTATLVDSSSQIWSNATVIASLRPAPNNPGLPLNNGLPITDSPQTAITNGSGVFTMTLDDTSHITPAGATWIFNIFPNATVPNANSITLAVTGASLNLSGPLSSILTPPQVFASPVINRAYTDSQANGGTGGIYWNTTSNTIRGCVFVSGSCNWVDIGNLSVPGSHFYIPYNNGGGSFTASVNLQFNDSTNTFTTPNATFATQALSAIFGSTTANKAGSGFLRLASTDQTCWRNNANSADLCLSKNSSDIFNLPGTLTVNTISSTNSTSTNATVTNKITVPSVNNVQYVDGITNTTVQAAINALPSSGGTVIVPSGYTETVTSPWIIGSASKVVTLNIDKSAVITFNVTGGVDAVQLYSKSSIISEGTNALLNQLILAPTANVSNFIATYPRTGGSIINMRGLTIQGNASATVSGALVDLVSVTDNSTFADLVIGQCANSYCLRIQNDGVGGASGPINFLNITVNGNALTGAKPVLIKNQGTSGIIGTINFFGGSLVHPGSGGNAIVDIQGGTNSLIRGVGFYGTQFESSNAADIGINIVNAGGILISNTLFTASGSAGTSCVKFSQSAAVTQDIIIDSITNFNGWTNTIQDAINTVNITDPTIARYTYLATSPAGSSYIYSNNGLVQQISVKGYANNAAALKHKRGTAGCATAATVGAACTTLVTWTTAFVDGNYTTYCGGRLITSGFPVNGGITGQDASSVTFQTIATTAAAAQYTNIDCIAIHDP